MKVITIGRSSENDLPINDPKVSRHHCQIVQHDDGTFTLADFGSLNGTYVNGQRIYGEVRLNPNDVVQIGNTILPWRKYFQVAVIIPQPRPLPPRKSKALPIVLGVLGGVTLIVAIVTLIIVFLSGGKDNNNDTYNLVTATVTDNVQSPIVNDPAPTKEDKRDKEDKQDKPNISGTWHWESAEKVDFYGEPVSSLVFDIVLKDEGITISGEYESVFGQGHTDIANNPVNGKWDGEKFVVNFSSNAWGGEGKATIKPLSSNRIEWRCISNQGEVHVPDKAVLTKK